MFDVIYLLTWSKLLVAKLHVYWAIAKGSRITSPGRSSRRGTQLTKVLKQTLRKLVSWTKCAPIQSQCLAEGPLALRLQAA